MRLSAAGITLVGLGLLAATGCQSGAGTYASTRPSWQWPWSKKPSAGETDIARNQQANPYPQLPSQMAQNPPQGAYSPNYYGTTTGADGYAQNPAGYPAQPGYGTQPAYGAVSPGYGAGSYAAQPPTGYSSPAASQGLYDQSGAVAQGGGYPLNQAGGYSQPPAAYADPSAAGVSNDYYNSAYARQDATGYAAAPPAGNYGAADGMQPATGYETQTGAALPANAGMPQVGYADAQMADARGAMSTPPAAGSAQPATAPNYAVPGSAYPPAAGQSSYGWTDPAPASTAAGNYNESAGFQPGSTGYTPGSNGFQPAGASPYQSPAGPYNTHPNNPNAGRYRPGSTGDYYQSGAASRVAPSGGQSSATGSAVSRANYDAVPGAAPAEVPAIYHPSASEAAANLQQ